jgi:hypothetical protein
MVMRCTVPKSGAAMSFASAEVTVDGEPVAQLAHIKYMPLRGVLGVVWDTVFSSMGIKLAEAWNGYALLADRKLLTPGNVEDDLASLLELRDVRSDSTEQGGLTANFGPIRLEQTNPLVRWHVLLLLASSTIPTHSSGIHGSSALGATIATSC